MKKPSTFCPLPWVSLSVRNNGDIRLCCQANVSENQGVLRKPDGKSFNTAFDSIDEARNSLLIRDVRKTMLRGEWHQSCMRCQTEEENGLRSRRIYSQDYLNGAITELKAEQETQQDGGIEVEKYPIKDMDLRFGNLCNLKCRMCGPTDSSAWYEDHVKLHGPSFKDSHGKVELRRVADSKYVTVNSDYNWYHSKEFWAKMEHSVASVEHLYIVGGEPLLIQSHFEFLQRVVESGNAANVTLEYNSNLTVLPEKAKELWPHFKKVRIGASVDGVGQVNEYIRTGSHFQEITENLKWFEESQGNFDIWLACTVSVYNIMHLPDFILWKINQGYKKINSGKEKPFLTTHLLHKPRYLNVRILPAGVKAQIEEKFTSKMAEICFAIESQRPPNSEMLVQSAQDLLNKYMHYMNSKDESLYFEEFKNYTQKLDALRGTSFSQIAEWYKDYSV